MRTRQTIGNEVGECAAGMVLVSREIERTGASATDMRTAAAFVASEAGPVAYDALSGRMRRLVDLLMAAPAPDRGAA